MVERSYLSKMNNEIFNEKSNENNEKSNESSNGNNEYLTIKELRKFEGFETITDDKANELLKSYDAFSSIIYDCFQKEILKTK